MADVAAQKVDSLSRIILVVDELFGTADARLQDRAEPGREEVGFILQEFEVLDKVLINDQGKRPFKVLRKSKEEFSDFRLLFLEIVFEIALQLDIKVVRKTMGLLNLLESAHFCQQGGLLGFLFTNVVSESAARH